MQEHIKEINISLFITFIWQFSGKLLQNIHNSDFPLLAILPWILSLNPYWLQDVQWMRQKWLFLIFGDTVEASIVKFDTFEGLGYLLHAKNMPWHIFHSMCIGSPVHEVLFTVKSGGSSLIALHNFYASPSRNSHP